MHATSADQLAVKEASRTTHTHTHTDTHTDTHTHTHTHTHTGTDKSLKTEGPKILSNDIFYFRTVIIGGPTLEGES